MKTRISALLVGMTGGLMLAVSAASAQTSETPWPQQMGPQWMMGQTAPMGTPWIMTPMGPQGGGPGWMMWAPQGLQPGGMGGAFHRFAIIDGDGDGAISDAEAAANHEEVFLTMDADEDGVLTREEYMAVRMGPGPMTAGGWRRFEDQAIQRKTAAFAEMDGDGDGSVSQREWMAAGEQRFAASDHDGDGVVSVWEFRSARRF